MSGEGGDMIRFRNRVPAPSQGPSGTGFVQPETPSSCAILIGNGLRLKYIVNIRKQTMAHPSNRNRIRASRTMFARPRRRHFSSARSTPEYCGAQPAVLLSVAHFQATWDILLPEFVPPPEAKPYISRAIHGLGRWDGRAQKDIGSPDLCKVLHIEKNRVFG